MIDANGIKSNVCKFFIYGKSEAINGDRYLIGNQFLKSYYVSFNYSGDGIIGFNGPYYPIEIHVPPKPFAPASTGVSPWIVGLVIGGTLLGVVGIFVCIKKKNEKLQEELDQL